MKVNSREKIIDFLTKNKEKQYNIKDFVVLCDVSRQAISDTLKKLEKENFIIKYGKSPKVFFQYNNFKKESLSDENIKNTKQIGVESLGGSVKLSEADSFVQDNFYTISPIGEKQNGLNAFKHT